MKRSAIALAGACSWLLACVVHDHTTYQDLPPSTVPPPPRIVLDAGSIVFSDADGVGIEGVGGAGTYTPDAAEVVDAAPDLATLDLAGVGATCHPLLRDCPNQALVCYPGASGTGFCSQPGSGGELANCNQSSDCAGGYYCGNGRTTSNICMLLCDIANPGCVKSSPCVEVPGFKDNTGYCLD